ncbi:MAG: M1 family metallopeptidase, partial [Saprospiraceae bacterium]|nr:M1 family metallopeptidase [Saprospiraceae bacterium]
TKQYVHGKASLTLKSHFYPTDKLELDAKVFDIHHVKMNGQSLSYDYDGRKLIIDLAKTFTRNENFTVDIDYTAKPNEGPSGGSFAILSDKGLFFINPLNENKNKPQQIWTQGETENNSRWFPTIDKPNERCSQEVYLTVEDRFKTLSNGKLVSSVKNGDGTRTDYWKQDKPHAPYLFMLGIGEYAVVKDKWNDIPLYYYVEPEYEKDAIVIFNHTPEMLDFFSDILDYPYPWDKYAQIVCRDYVSGAMENTGAVVFGESVQKTSRELLDGDNDDIVAHEMFHHWFGDLVTCESWSNLTLNEGFATYSEYLWREYKYGHDSAERKRLQDLNGYLMSAGQQGSHDLIDFEYNNKEDMFDGHSYNKGALIVHMLRNYVGDDAFFASLNKYLQIHQYSDVEAHELRMAFEDVTGEDLNWFFNQWFYDQGHPELDIEYVFDEESKKVVINVNQMQDPEDSPAIFQFPVKTRLYYESGDHETKEFWINERQQEIIIDINRDEMPLVAVLDGTHDLLAVSSDNLSDAQYFHLFMNSDEFTDKINALSALKKNKDYSSIFGYALNDDSEEIRSMAIRAVDAEQYDKKLRQIALKDNSSANRAAAIKKVKDFDLALKSIKRDSSYRVIKQALHIVNKESPETALQIINGYRQGYYKPLVAKMADIYAATGETGYLSFFAENINQVDMFEFFNYLRQYEKLAKKGNTEQIMDAAQRFYEISTDQSNNYFAKYSSANSIKNLIAVLEKRNSGKEDQELDKAISEMEDMLYQFVSSSSDKRIKSGFSKYNKP